MPRRPAYRSQTTFLGRAVAVTLGCLGLGCGLADLEPSEVGESRACVSASQWPSDLVVLEDELRLAIADVRDEGRLCPDDDPDAMPQGVVELMDVPELRCAARVHATDQARAGTLVHEGFGGSTPFSRVNVAGYDGIVRHELLAANIVDPLEVLETWLAEQQHCAALVDKNLDHIGIGLSQDDGEGRLVWVVVTGQIRE